MVDSEDLERHLRELFFQSSDKSRRVLPKEETVYRDGGRSVQFFGFGKLNDFSEVHNGYSVAEIVHDVQVMRNEEVS